MSAVKKWLLFVLNFINNSCTLVLWSSSYLFAPFWVDIFSMFLVDFYFLFVPPGFFKSPKMMQIRLSCKDKEKVYACNPLLSLFVLCLRCTIFFLIIIARSFSPKATLNNTILSEQYNLYFSPYRWLKKGLYYNLSWLEFHCWNFVHLYKKALKMCLCLKKESGHGKQSVFKDFTCLLACLFLHLVTFHK